MDAISWPLSRARTTLSRESVVSSAIEISFLETSLALAEIYEDVILPPLHVREGEDWDADDWAEVESD